MKGSKILSNGKVVVDRLDLLGAVVGAVVDGAERSYETVVVGVVVVVVEVAEQY